MNYTKPANSPGCWGMQYSDADAECQQCPCKDSCRPTTINRVVSQPIRTFAPQPPPLPQMGMVPLPSRTYLPQMTPQPPPVPVPVYKPPMQNQMIQYAAPAPVAVQQYNPMIPDPNNPNPMMPMARPGASGPPYYFTQYPGESIPQRLGKNIALRGAEAIFAELMFFFRHWTWPPR